MKLTEAIIKFGSLYHIAKVAGLNVSTVTRWKGPDVPGKHIPALRKAKGGQLKRGGLRG